MQGNIWVESKPGEGATFHFTAVMRKSASQPKPFKAAEDLQGKRVLVVDDNIANNEILKSILEPGGMIVTTLTDESKTIAMLHQAHLGHKPFDLAILDIFLPTISGYELASSIREDETAITSIPLLAYTSSSEKIAARCRGAGFSAFLSKPARRAILFKTIAKILSSDAIAEQKLSTASMITQYSVREEIKQSARLLLAEDNLVNQKLATMMLEKAGYTVEVVDNGKMAVDTFCRVTGSI